MNVELYVELVVGGGPDVVLTFGPYPEPEAEAHYRRLTHDLDKLAAEGRSQEKVTWPGNPNRGTRAAHIERVALTPVTEAAKQLLAQYPKILPLAVRYPRLAGGS